MYVFNVGYVLHEYYYMVCSVCVLCSVLIICLVSIVCMLCSKTVFHMQK